MDAFIAVGNLALIAWAAFCRGIKLGKGLESVDFASTDGQLVTCLGAAKSVPRHHVQHHN